MSVIDNYKRITENIKLTCKKLNKDYKSINIVAVSKKQQTEKIKLLLDSGHNSFGENRLDEYKFKWKNFHTKKIKLHFIGALQSKKVKDIISNFNVIETLDTESSAKKLANFIVNKNIKPPKLYFQVNVGEEKQKRGIYISQIESFLIMCRETYKLKIDGAMCMPPKNKKPEEYFKILKEVCDAYNLKEISMGMSNDYKKAVEFGATNIRIGTLIFGSRK